MSHFCATRSLETSIFGPGDHVFRPWAPRGPPEGRTQNCDSASVRFLCRKGVTLEALLAYKIGSFLEWFLDRVFDCIWTEKGPINQWGGGMRGASFDFVKGGLRNLSVPCTPGGGGGF